MIKVISPFPDREEKKRGPGKGVVKFHDLGEMLYFESLNPLAMLFDMFLN